jgi:hypothetical protein
MDNNILYILLLTITFISPAFWKFFNFYLKEKYKQKVLNKKEKEKIMNQLKNDLNELNDVAGDFFNEKSGRFGSGRDLKELKSTLDKSYDKFYITYRNAHHYIKKNRKIQMYLGQLKGVNSLSNDKEFLLELLMKKQNKKSNFFRKILNYFFKNNENFKLNDKFDEIFDKTDNNSFFNKAYYSLK